MKNSWRNSLLLLGLSTSTLAGWEGQVQVSPYFDSNVRESLTNPASSFGVKLRGNLEREMSRTRWRMYGNLMGQTYLDGVFSSESKLIANLDSGFRYALSQRLHLVSHLAHFQKNFYSRPRSYRRTEYAAYFRALAGNSTTGWVGYVVKSTAFRTGETIRFQERELEVRARYAGSRRFSLEGTVTSGTIVYRDYEAWGVDDDTSLVRFDFDQQDEFRTAMVHFRYQGKVITGFQTGLENVSSNSVVGEYRQVIYRLYLSGRLGKSYFYHLVFQRVDKHYEYPLLQGETGFRDPEERIQNRTYFQVETQFRNGSVGFLQISLLENETILNQQYYDKKMLELGLKHAFE